MNNYFNVNITTTTNTFHFTCVPVDSIIFLIEKYQDDLVHVDIIFNRNTDSD